MSTMKAMGQRLQCRVLRVGATMAMVDCLAAAQTGMAAASTDSGTVNCGANTVAVRGEQQLYGDWLTLKVHNVVIYHSPNVYDVVRSSNFSGTRTWSGSSESLYYAGTYGMCLPGG